MSTIENVKVELPLPASANAKTVADTCNAHSEVIKQAPAYSTTPAAQTAVAAMDAAVVDLEGDLTKIDQLNAEIKIVEGTRDDKVIVARLAHDAVESALNTASKGDPKAAKAWTGKTKARAKKSVVTPTTDPPVNPALRTIKRHSGAVEASCTKEAGAICYLVQIGTDALHPEIWPSPVHVNGHTYKVENLPIGQVICARIAVIRRGSVQSQWSPVLQIVVR